MKISIRSVFPFATRSNQAAWEIRLHRIAQQEKQITLVTRSSPSASNRAYTEMERAGRGAFSKDLA
jgi:hypothetical protein